MMKDRQDPFSGMSLEELWQLFPVFLTEHRRSGRSGTRRKGSGCLVSFPWRISAKSVMWEAHPSHPSGQAHSGYPGGNEGMWGYAGHEGTYYRGRLHLHDGKGREDFVQQGLHAVGICGEGIPSASERGRGITTSCILGDYLREHPGSSQGIWRSWKLGTLERI